MSQLIVDPEFKALCSPLDSDEAMALQESILSEGVREPLRVWLADGKVILLDGHHRLSICETHSLHYETAPVLDIKTRDDARIWIIQNQLARRNLAPYARTQLVLKLEPLLAERAKANQGRRTDIGQNSARSSERTKDALARAAGVSHDTVHRVKALEAHADAETKAKLSRGETTINAEYQKLKSSSPSKSRDGRGKAGASRGSSRSPRDFQPIHLRPRQPSGKPPALDALIELERLTKPDVTQWSPVDIRLVIKELRKAIETLLEKRK